FQVFQPHIITGPYPKAQRGHQLALHRSHWTCPMAASTTPHTRTFPWVACFALHKGDVPTPLAAPQRSVCMKCQTNKRLCPRLPVS
ncbi:mCG145988, partial [Mus musculus]